MRAPARLDIPGRQRKREEFRDRRRLRNENVRDDSRLCTDNVGFTFKETNLQAASVYVGIRC